MVDVYYDVYCVSLLTVGLVGGWELLWGILQSSTLVEDEVYRNCCRAVQR